MKRNVYALICFLFITGTALAQSISIDLVPENTFTSGIEGPAADTEGNIYAVNYGKQGTVGLITPCGKHSLFVTLPEGSTGNGIRFGSDGTMYVADYTGHNILKIEMLTRNITVFAHEDSMNQPNDLTIAPDGTIYASDPAWPKNTGKLWQITTKGEVRLLSDEMGTTNGIEVSPDGHKLYVNESVQRNVWVFDINSDGSLSNKRLFYSFPDFGMDGMRCDNKGNLYLCRYGKGTVIVLTPEGLPLHEYVCKGKKPSNITFGGKDNKKIYITLQDRGCIEVFDALNPGSVPYLRH